ncbi:hypothetical protein EGW08_008898 [Elysia chlorotica]|uniref:CABIT domain-containing protein n=1 Tax=Elysia chlorotica TaxID=188477 RepID=A0A433TP98_ELYCH|nr:hypothetical protein EGW08_008898 [Elysia chlorotica]
MGQTLIIPYDYAGWFEVIPSDFSRATCYTSIDAVAQAMPASFFTRSNLKGIRVEGEDDHQKYLERKIAAGSVLKTNGTFKAKWKTRAQTGLFKKKTKEWDMEEVTYLKCIDHDSLEILVPITHKGKFNAIYEKGKLTPNAVYSMKNILDDLSLPVMVRLLFGKAPVVPCIFTGTLILRETAVDDAIIGSSILNQRNVLFEIPLNAPVKVKYTSSDEHFAETDSYRDAKKLCRKYSDLFSTMIKLSAQADSSQKVIQHVPTDPSLMRDVDEALRALDLITDISLTSEPKDHLLDPSDSSSQGSYDQQNPIPKEAVLEAQRDSDYKSREFQTHV